MYRYLLLLMMGVSTTLFANPKNFFEDTISRLEKKYRESLSELHKLGVGSALGLETGFGYITDEKAMYKLPAVYWVQAHKDEFIKFSETEITTIPVAFNNILESVVESGWDKHVAISDEDYEKWRMEKRNFSFQYVDTNFKGERQFKSVDPALYMKAERIYQEALADASSIKEKADKNKDAISLELGEYYRANAELSLYYKLRRLTDTANNARTPTTVGEHTETKK